MFDDGNDDGTADVSTDGEQSIDPASHGSTTWKVLGEIDAPDGAGVLGHNTATSGTALGVRGVTDSEEDGAVGVFGHATAAGSPVETWGVVGFSDADADPGNNVFPAGVRGKATGSGGVTGVVGFVDDPGGLGVGGVAVTGTAVFGRAFSSADGTRGVDGWASATSGRTYGVKGRTNSPTDGAAGVRGIANATSGQTYGVRGRSDSSAGYGVYSNGDSKTDGNHEVTGTLLGSGIVGTANIGSEAVTNSKIDSGTTIDRGKLDTDRNVTLVDSSNTASYTTNGEETVFVNTNTKSVTITLSDSDGVNGRSIRVVDAGGNAGTNGITIEAGGTDQLEGPNSSSITTISGYREYEHYLGTWYEVSSN